MSDRLALIATCMALCTLAACDYQAYQSDMQTVAVGGSAWTRGDTIAFRCYAEATDSPRDLYLYVRHNNLYEYTALPVGIRLSSPLGWTASGTFVLPLSDTPMVWSGSGYALRQHLYRLHPAPRPPFPGLYRIEVWQNSPADTLPGIETIGLSWSASPPPAP